MWIISLPFPKLLSLKVPSRCASYQSVLEKSWIAYVKKKNFLNFILFWNFDFGDLGYLGPPIGCENPLQSVSWRYADLSSVPAQLPCSGSLFKSCCRWTRCSFLAYLYSCPEREPHSATVLIPNINAWHFEIKNQSFHPQKKKSVQFIFSILEMM